MCSIQALIANCLLLFGEDGEVDQEMITTQSVFKLVLDLSGFDKPSDYRQRKEYNVFLQLLRMVPHLTERLAESSNEEYTMVADLVRLTGALNPSLSLLLDSKRHVKRQVRRHQES